MNCDASPSRSDRDQVAMRVGLMRFVPSQGAVVDARVFLHHQCELRVRVFPADDSEGLSTRHEERFDHLAGDPTAATRGWAQLFVGWNSEPHARAAIARGDPGDSGRHTRPLVPLTHGRLMLTVGCFMLLFGGIKALQPAFWSLPNLLLTESAAAGASASSTPSATSAGRLEALHPW